MHHAQRTRVPTLLETAGAFSIGCNYWASHAGTSMWRDWRPDVVRRDLEKLAASGVRLLRVFPLWPDFQPITLLYGYGGTHVEIRHDETPLRDAGAGTHGVSPVMLGRLSEFCAIAAACDVRLIVGLVTGWMSGRLFVPPALAGRNVITDPLCLTWQVKLVGAIVAHAAAEEAIVAWDLGNECNCMGDAGSTEAAYVWTASIANAIRAADPTRPVISGMHSLSTAIGRPDGRKPNWTIEDQGELTDILTTHPYPYWSRHTRADRVDSLRTTMHATAETRLYADVSGKPCFAEEIGTMGPMVASDPATADFARVNLFSLWANDCRGMLWWCSSDQHALKHPPYDWIGVELELGLLREDGTAKPVLDEMATFRDFLAALPFERLPRRRADAVCLLTHGVDDWAAAYGAFVLGKQAGLELDFHQIEAAIPEASLYLLPSLKGVSSVPRRKCAELLDRVRRGATLYLSLDDGIVPHFNEVAGVEVIARSRGLTPSNVRLDDGTLIPIRADERILVEARGAEVLGRRDEDGSPLFWRHRLDDGQLIVVACPLEVSVTTTVGAFDADAPAAWKLYAHLPRDSAARVLPNAGNPNVAVTEHRLADDAVFVIAINHTNVAQAMTWQTGDAIESLSCARGSALLDGHGQLTASIPAFDALAMTLKRRPE